MTTKSLTLGIGLILIVGGCSQRGSGAALSPPVEEKTTPSPSEREPGTTVSSRLSAEPDDSLPNLPTAVIARLGKTSFGKDLCSDLVKLPKMLENCAIEFLANGTAARILAVSQCGAHACDVESFLFTSGRKAFIEETYGPSTWEVTPDHRYLLRGDLDYIPIEAEEARFVPAEPNAFLTTRTDLDTGEVTPFAPCISPKLSPQGKWIVCRTFDGGVAKIPTAGGTLQIVESSKIPPDDSLKVGGPFGDYPGPVIFLSDTRFRYGIYLKSETSMELEALWIE